MFESISISAIWHALELVLISRYHEKLLIEIESRGTILENTTYACTYVQYVCTYILTSLPSIILRFCTSEEVTKFSKIL